MSRYILKRILLMIPVILGVIVLVFTLLYFSPGDATSIILGTEWTEEGAQALREEMGLNDPYIVQLARYIWNAVRLDFGSSWVSGVPVAHELSSRIPRTLLIGSISIMITAACGILLGVVAATHQNKWQDAASTIIALIGTSLPNFFFALLLVLAFAYRLRWLPAFGLGDWKNYVLPILANAVGGIAMLTRQTRSSMLEVIRSDYITTAWSKGLPERKVIFGHALANALIPIITVIGSQFGRLIGGVVVVETIFSIRGLSVYLLNGINSRDYPVVTGSLIVIAFLFSMVMLIADLVYTFIDPRIKAKYVKVRRSHDSNGD